MKLFKLSVILTIFINLFFVLNVSATESCKEYIASNELKYKIPKRLLQAIAITESDTKPWTIQYQGRSYYFKDKANTLQFIKKLRKKGITNFDIGCMQINYYYHRQNFKSIDELLDPKGNVSYAARYLKELYDKLGSWHYALSAYNAGSYNLAGKKYTKKVLDNWLNAKLEYKY